MVEGGFQSSENPKEDSVTAYTQRLGLLSLRETEPAGHTLGTILGRVEKGEPLLSQMPSPSEAVNGQELSLPNQRSVKLAHRSLWEENPTPPVHTKELVGKKG